MIASLLALALAAIPEGSARFRFELSGEHVGVADLSVSCMGETCTALWTSEKRAPVDAGGRRSSRRIEVEVDRAGVWRGGKLRVTEDGGAVKAEGAPDAIPASLAEVVLARLIPLPPRKGWQSALPPGPESCVETFDETTGRRGQACARRDGEALSATVLGVEETIVPAADGFPASVALPAQAARFVRDAEATVPRRPPRLHGTTVAGPADPAQATSFCGVARDPEVDGAALGFLPPPRAEGAGCLEKTAAWLARAARAGVRGRTAVGVAWDGERYAWHAWAEVRLERGWIPVDPTFGELPARGPRFTIAVHEPGDEAARLRAGERILACWGRERVR